MTACVHCAFAEGDPVYCAAACRRYDEYRFRTVERILATGEENLGPITAERRQELSTERDTIAANLNAAVLAEGRRRELAESP